jgi:outer membrane protein OmpA-like peptidoglycan-associated protein
MKHVATTALCLFFAAGVGYGVQARGALTKSTKAVGYVVGGGSTTIDFLPSDLMRHATGKANVTARQGKTEIDAAFKGLAQPTTFGAEFLTYVLWAVSPDGHAANLGEIMLHRDGTGKLEVSTALQTFSLIVTAEPFFAVRIPSELIILENAPRKQTKAKIFIVDNYSLMRRAQYQKLANPLALTVDLKSQPLEMYEARNAVAIAKSNAADEYAPEIYRKASASLQMAENALQGKKNRKEIISTAKQTIQFSQDALTLSIQRQEDELIANERAAREDAERRAREQAQAEAQRRMQAEAGRARAEADKARADAERARADAARAKAEMKQQEARRKAEDEARLRAEADASKAKALDAQRQAERDAEQAQREKAQLRARLLDQFNRVLETRDTERGLVVNMSDVLFDTGKYSLRSEAREKLARIAGIVMNYPRLTLQAEGHTDGVGSLEYNQKLSEQRAASVREYLMSQGLPEESLTAVGKAFTLPVASNDTAQGRRQNRRVELIVSGEVIGTQVRKSGF